MLSLSSHENAEEELAGTRMAQAVHHADELLKFLQKRVEVEDAADIRQEVLLRTARASAAPIANMRAYLFQIARNLLIDRARQKRAAVEIIPLDATGGDLICEQPRADRVMEATSDLKALKEALSRIPKRQRLALLWTRVDGVPLKEVGRRLGVSESMASRYVIQALAQCRGKFE